MRKNLNQNWDYVLKVWWPVFNTMYIMYAIQYLFTHGCHVQHFEGYLRGVGKEKSTDENKIISADFTFIYD